MQAVTANSQSPLDAQELAVVLALVRTGKLAAAGERLGIDGSTVFRILQKLERGLGTPLFARSRNGYAATELARQLAEQAERIEAALDQARTLAHQRSDELTGHVRITTTDTLLHGLLAPALLTFQAEHPLLTFDLHSGNELASLSRRDADLALRATAKPPEHLVGRRLGTIRVALYARDGTDVSEADALAGRVPWIAPDEALPMHPSVQWRRQAAPAIRPRFLVNSILTVGEMIAQGFGVGVLPVFLGRRLAGVRALSAPLEEGATELWLLTHPEARHVRRVHATFTHLADAVPASGTLDL